VSATGRNQKDLNGDRVVNAADVLLAFDAFGSCVRESGYLYEAC
jgi:hypothetical protein